jgi:PIN domain nuclease of toxin-antitoxin system
VRLLIDTHALLWWRDDSPRLSARARNEITNPNNDIWVSIVTLWEIVLKRSNGKLNFPDNLEQVLREEAFPLMSIGFRHLETLERLPFVHKDPFDRLLIAQAIAEGMPLLSNDRALLAYGAAVVW